MRVLQHVADERARFVLPHAPLFPHIDRDGDNLRNAFYKLKSPLA